MARIVFTTIGSLGDLYPYLALALELRRRGHEPRVITVEQHRERVEAAGITFAPLRVGGADLNDAELMKRAMDPRHGSEYIFRELIIPTVRETTEDIRVAARGADLLVSHVLTFGTRIVAEKEGLPWLSTTLAPMAFLSAYDPPVLTKAPFLRAFHGLGPGFTRTMLGLLKWLIRDWGEPIQRLREEMGLQRITQPILEGSHSPYGVLALFSRALGEPQPDWPVPTIQTGFPFYDTDGSLSEELQQFLETGEPPIVFTLGSAAVMNPGEFYRHSVQAARQLGVRAVLVTGPEAVHRPENLPPGQIAIDYAPFSALFARARVIVHQGGVGTTGQALRAGKPMLVVPVAHDQPDNADRIRRQGIGRVLYHGRYTARRAVAELSPLLQDSQYAQRASAAAKLVAQEGGTRAACDAIESTLSKR